MASRDREVMYHVEEHKKKNKTIFLNSQNVYLFNATLWHGGQCGHQ